MCVCLGGLFAGCGVCPLFVYVVVFVQRVSGYVVCQSGCMKMCGVHTGLCALERDGGDRERAVNAECTEGGVYLGWGCGCAEFPRRVPRAGGGRGWHLPAWRGAGNRSPFPHEILIRPSSGPGKKAGQAGSEPQLAAVLGAVVSPQTAASELRLGWGREEETSPSTCTLSGAPASEDELACLYRPSVSSATPSRKREQGPNGYFVEIQYSPELGWPYSWVYLGQS